MRRIVILLAIVLAGCGGGQAATPTRVATVAPAATSTIAPTIAPTATVAPTSTTAPSMTPTIVATIAPTATPTLAPPIAPTAEPIVAPIATSTITATAAISLAADVRIVALDERAEIVQIRNLGTAAQDMTGWVLQSVGGGTCELLDDQLFAFPAGFVLEPGAEVRVVSGPDAAGDGQSVLWWTEKNIWANERDRGELRDGAGRVVGSFPYGGCE